jgi:hypothetical protein
VVLSYAAGTNLLYLEDDFLLDCCVGDALMMKAASTSETLVNFYQTTRRNNPDDNHLHTRRRGNLKSHLALTY